jgi:hypothetical protein
LKIMQVSDRRTLRVLVSLMGAMTVGSGLLLLLDPGPSQSVVPISLSSVEGVGWSGSEVSFASDGVAAPVVWSSILVCDGGRIPQGSGYSGHSSGVFSGFHFVIGRGRQIQDGRIEIGWKWEQQLPGTFDVEEWMGGNPSGVIGICMEGDGELEPFTEKQMRSLVWLVQSLQGGHQISAERVVIESGAMNEEVAVGRLFPVAWFRQQLLSYAMP